jgi:two-component system chemotaxis response regulator CheB
MTRILPVLFSIFFSLSNYAYPPLADSATKVRLGRRGGGVSSRRTMLASPQKRPPFEIVALAASAGGLKALTEVLSALKAGFPVPILVVQHLDRGRRSLMAEILGRRCAIAVKEAAHGERVRPGVAYVAPSDHHLLVDAAGMLTLTHTELVHFVRPSADLLFESMAAGYRERAIAVVLSGSGRDGAMGVKAVKKMGGTVIVQDEKSSEFFGMPDAARQTGIVDSVLPLGEIAAALSALTSERGAG